MRIITALAAIASFALVSTATASTIPSKIFGKYRGHIVSLDATGNQIGDQVFTFQLTSAGKGGLRIKQQSPLGPGSYTFSPTGTVKTAYHDLVYIPGEGTVPASYTGSGTWTASGGKINFEINFIVTTNTGQTYEIIANETLSRKGRTLVLTTEDGAGDTSTNVLTRIGK